MAEQKWQPAETAPKDGSEFLAWCPHGEGSVEIGHYYRLSHTVYEPAGEGLFRAREEEYASGWNCNYFTHWMPLPEPPK